jgi:hypothetical protein
LRAPIPFERVWLPGNPSGAKIPPTLQIDDLDRPIRGAKAFSDVLGPDRPEKKVRYRLERDQLDADKLGRNWISTPRRLLDQFAGKGPVV